MSYRIDFRPEAERELGEAYAWYELQQPQLGDDFLAQIGAALERIAEFPRAAPVIYRDVRRHLLDRFPHSILYTVEPDRIVVLAVYHGSRDPSGWENRR